MISTLLLAAFTLVGADRSAKVVIPENAEPSTRLCVEELTNYVAKICGVVLPVDAFVSNASKKDDQSSSDAIGTIASTKGALIIGTLKTLGDVVPAAARAALEKSKKFEAGWMGTVDGNLWIVGKEETADMYLTYHFLETKLGVRWFQAALPEDPGDWYPTVKVEKAGGGGESGGLVIQDFQEFREPDFVRRLFGQQNSYYDVIPYAGKICGYRNGFQFHCPFSYWACGESALVKEHRAFYDPRFSKRFRSVGGHWTCRNVFPCTKYLKTNPELFALENGVRGGGRKATEQYCLSNPMLIEGCIKYYVKFFKENGGVGVFSFGQSDTSVGFCECEKCRALDGPHEGAHLQQPNFSSRISWFANKLFEGIRKECPEVEFNYEPYVIYRPIPEIGEMNPERVYCQYSPHGRCYKHRFDDPTCRRNAPLFKEMLQWHKRLPYGPWVYEYFTDTFPLYVCHEFEEAADIRLYKSLGMVGWYNEGFQTGAKFLKFFMPDTAEVYPSNWQWAYMVGHLLWDAAIDEKKLIEDAESKYYGVAYPAMKKYQELRRKLWASHNECMGYPSGDPVRPLLLNEEGAKEKLLAYLDEAEKLVEDGIFKHRIGRDRFWLNTYWIKPNEKVRYEVAHAMSVPFVTAPIAVDGDPSDAAWAKAQETSSRFLTEGEHAPARKPVPDHLKCSVKITRDDANFYVLCQAEEKDMAHLKTEFHKKDDPVHRDDCFEIFFYPPSIENAYYQVAVNSEGVVYDSRCPGFDESYDLGIVAKAGKTATGWCVELKVPVKKMHPLIAGEYWRLQIGRGRSGRERPTHLTMGGTISHDTANYVPFKIEGAPIAAERPVGAAGSPRVMIVNEPAEHYFVASAEQLERQTDGKKNEFSDLWDFRFPKDIDLSERGVERYVDALAGTNLTHYFINVNYQRAFFPSKTIEPIWTSLDEPGRQQQPFIRNMRDAFARGLDVYAVMIRRCREKGVSPFLSFRMNDIHGTQAKSGPMPSTFWRAHPEWHVGDDAGWENGLDYAQKPVRDRMSAFIREALERYDADGIELDLIRFPHYFRPGTERKNAPILTAFLREVRATCDAAAKRRGHPVKIAARFLPDPKRALAMGAGVDVWSKEGLLDMAIPCNMYGSIEYEYHVDDWRKLLTDRTQFIAGTDNGIVESGKRRILNLGEYRAWIDKMRKDGTDGIYFFNFPIRPYCDEVWCGVLGSGVRVRADGAFKTETPKR